MVEKAQIACATPDWRAVVEQWLTSVVEVPVIPQTYSTIRINVDDYEEAYNFLAIYQLMVDIYKFLK